MRRVFIVVMSGFLLFPLAGSGTAFAADNQTPLAPISAEGVDLSQFVWTNRIIVVFADNPADPAYIDQLQMLAKEPGDLASRDVLVITDADPAARTAVRQRLRPRGFSVVWIDKDGAVRLRKPSPWSVRELAHAIDKTPLRLQEIAEGKPAG